METPFSPQLLSLAAASTPLLSSYFTSPSHPPFHLPVTPSFNNLLLPPPASPLPSDSHASVCFQSVRARIEDIFRDNSVVLSQQEKHFLYSMSAGLEYMIRQRGVPLTACAKQHQEELDFLKCDETLIPDSSSGAWAQSVLVDPVPPPVRTLLLVATEDHKKISI
jgi:hypothetical protein